VTGDRHPPLLVAWALVAVVALTWGLGSYPVMDQDEGRNAEVAREMAETNDYVLPHLNGLPYIDKPILFFAAAAGVMEVLGPTELAARMVPLVCALATALLIGWRGGRWFGREAGWVAGIVAVSAPLPLAFSRIVILDSLLTLFVTGAILSLHAAVEARVARRPDRLWTLAGWAAIGFGVLTKGPVALAVPLMVVGPYAAYRRASWSVWNPVGPLLMVAVVGPWVWFMEDRLPGYLQYVAVTETWQRVTGDELRRSQPWWFFLAVATMGFFPWWPLAFGRRRLDADGRDPKRVLLMLWLLVPLAFFSVATSKLPQYILPLMPAVALLVASHWYRQDRLPRRGSALAIAGLVCTGAVFLTVAAGGLDNQEIQPALLASLKRPSLVMAGICLVAAVWALIALRTERGAALVAALSLPIIAIPVVLSPSIRVLAEQRSEHGLVALIRSELPSGAKVVGVHAWRPSVSFYLRRVVPIFSADGDELRSNYVLRTYDRWVDADGVLRPPPAVLAELARCRQLQVLLVNAKHPDHQAEIEKAGLEPIWRDPKLIAYACDPLKSPSLADAEVSAARRELSARIIHE
jgi:4-amino-4-deoxy-L-arabinose transferase-like glycosyltransferase